MYRDFEVRRSTSIVLLEMPSLSDELRQYFESPVKKLVDLVEILSVCSWFMDIQYLYEICVWRWQFHAVCRLASSKRFSLGIRSNSIDA